MTKGKNKSVFFSNENVQKYKYKNTHINRCINI